MAIRSKRGFMTQHRTPAAHYQSVLEELAHPRRIDSLGPLAARFSYAIRLIALHERVGRDPVPELAARLGSVEVAAKALALSQAIASTWPENIHVSRFCCCHLTHDEATIGAMLEASAGRNRDEFGAQLEGLVRPDRITRLWEAAQDLVLAEMRAV